MHKRCAIAILTLVLSACDHKSGTPAVADNLQPDATSAPSTVVGPPPQREPGSWTQQIELKRFDGKDAEKTRAALTRTFAKMKSMSICVTPEMAAKEDPIENLEKLGGTGGSCTFDKKSVAGGNLDVSGTCRNARGGTARITAAGTLRSSARDIDVTIESQDASGAKDGVMELQTHWTRNGACTAKDRQAPTAAL